MYLSTEIYIFWKSSNRENKLGHAARKWRSSDREGTVDVFPFTPFMLHLFIIKSHQLYHKKAAMGPAGVQLVTEDACKGPERK